MTSTRIITIEELLRQNLMVTVLLQASGALDFVVAQLKQEQLSSKQRQWGLSKIVWVLSKKDNKGGKVSSFANWASQVLCSAIAVTWRVRGREKQMAYRFRERERVIAPYAVSTLMAIV